MSEIDIAEMKVEMAQVIGEIKADYRKVNCIDDCYSKNMYDYSICGYRWPTERQSCVKRCPEKGLNYFNLAMSQCRLKCSAECDQVNYLFEVEEKF